MEITPEQNKELDFLKMDIELMEKRKSNALVKFNLACDDEVSDKKEFYSKNIDELDKMIKRSISVQAKSMNIDTDLCADLIFDREEVLKTMNYGK